MKDNIFLRTIVLVFTAFALGTFWGILLPSPLNLIVGLISGVFLGWNWNKVWAYLTEGAS